MYTKYCSFLAFCILVSFLHHYMAFVDQTILIYDCGAASFETSSFPFHTHLTLTVSDNNVACPFGPVLHCM